MSVLTQLYNQIKLKSEEVNRRESLHSPHSNGLIEVREEVPLSPQQKARNNFFSPVAEMAENGVVTEEGFSPVQDPHDIEYGKLKPTVNTGQIYGKPPTARYTVSHQRPDIR